MQNTIPLFPGFHLQTLRRTPSSARQQLLDEIAKIKQKTFSGLTKYLSHVVPIHHLTMPGSGPMSRRRIYSKENTFWAFFSQVLDADGGCQEVVRKLQAVASIHSKTVPSSSTAAYCQTRQLIKKFGLKCAHRKLAVGFLKRVFVLVLIWQQAC